MEVKLIEIRDRATFIAAVAVKLVSRSEAEMFLLRRAGYSREQATPGGRVEPYVVLSRLDGGGKMEYDPYSWGNRTMGNAHKHLIENWASIESGQVVDVEYVLGETTAPKRSERFD